MPATLDRDELPEGVSCADPEGWVDTRPADAPSRVFDDRKLERVEPFANAYTHPVTDPDGHVIEPTTAPYDAVKNPPHYAQYAIQPIEFTLKNKLGFCEGNVIKYVCRYNLKDGMQDLEKAREYIDILIAAHKEREADYDRTGD